MHGQLLWQQVDSLEWVKSRAILQFESTEAGVIRSLDRRSEWEAHFCWVHVHITKEGATDQDVTGASGQAYPAKPPV